jgi:NAD+ synthase
MPSTLAWRINMSTPGPTETEYEALAGQIAGWLRSQLEASGMSRLVLGLSGGIDSAVVCALAVRAAGPENVVAAILPVRSLPQDVQDAELAARAFGVDPILVDLAPAFEAMVASLPEATRDGDQRLRHLALANVKPRLRMTALYYLAQLHRGLVVGTGNKTELSIGYFTKYGDGGVDLLPLADLDKSMVRALARTLGVPEPILAKAPSAGLWEGQTDEGEIGLTYDQLDRALADLERGAEERVDPAVRERIGSLIAISEHKRQPIPRFARDERKFGMRE